MTSRNWSGVSRVAGTAVPLPALFTSTSTRPNSVIAASTTAGASSGTATVRGYRQRPPAQLLNQGMSLLEPICAARGQHHVGARLGKCRAKAMPKTEEAPVTIATFRRAESGRGP